jgi:hypothetical protein
MRAKSLLTAGFVALVAATGVAYVSESFAADARRVDVVGTLNEKVAQSDSKAAGGDGMRVDVIGHIGAEGPSYPYTKPTSR